MDAVATIDDTTFRSAPTTRLFHFRLAERVLSRLPPPARILDIGCGTGDDALWLAGHGYEVHGVDRSEAMIEVARKKMNPTKARLSFDCRPLESLSPAGGRYDVVISNFGALNCVPLPIWTSRAPDLLREGGYGFVVLMRPRLFPERIRRGLQPTGRENGAAVRVGSSTLPVFHPGSREVRKALERAVTVTHVEAMGCLLPGPRYGRLGPHYPTVFGALAMGECLLRSLPLFRDGGDHTLFEFRRA